MIQAVTGTSFILIPKGGPLQDPVAVAASIDGARLIVAMQSGKLLVRDQKTGANQVTDCACRPEGLTRLKGNAHFLLSADPLKIVDLH